MSGEGGHTPEEAVSAGGSPNLSGDQRRPGAHRDALRFTVGSPKGSEFLRRVKDMLSLKGPDQGDDPTLRQANVLDQSARSMDLPQGMGGGLSSTRPTAEGLAKAQDAAASTQPTPPTPGTQNQGS
jgi:hypothetical protein